MRVSRVGLHMDESNITDTLIIGAGMAGLSCATKLQVSGRTTLLLDKGRGPGGRMATRRVDLEGSQLRFDHGAQYFTVREPAFQDAVRDWLGKGVVAPWPDAGKDAWVGTPSMNAPLKHMAQTAAVHWGTRVTELEKQGAEWRVVGEAAEYRATNLVIAIPPEQASALLQDVAPDLAEEASQVRSDPSWALMVQFPERLPFEPNVYRSADGPVAWAARNSAKPGRDGGETWVIHASVRRTRELLDIGKDAVIEPLLADFFSSLAIVPQEPTYAAAHRWLYAKPSVTGEGPAIWDQLRKIGLAGDWLHSPRVEGAFLSGHALAQEILGT